MGDVLNRGSRDKPRWYCRFIDADGRRKQRATAQPTRALALRVLTEIEARICRGQTLSAICVCPRLCHHV